MSQRQDSSILASLIVDGFGFPTSSEERSISSTIPHSGSPEYHIECSVPNKSSGDGVESGFGLHFMDFVIRSQSGGELFFNMANDKLPFCAASHIHL